MITILWWNPEGLKALLTEHNITNRSELADFLAAHGIARTTIYRVFDENWAGRATLSVLAALAHVFKVPLSKLVTEPGGQPE